MSVVSHNSHTYLFLSVCHHFGSFVLSISCMLIICEGQVVLEMEIRERNWFYMWPFLPEHLGIWGSFAFSCSAVVMEMSPWRLRLEWIEDVMREDTMTVPYRPSRPLTEQPMYFCSKLPRLIGKTCEWRHFYKILRCFLQVLWHFQSVMSMSLKMRSLTHVACCILWWFGK